MFARTRIPTKFSSVGHIIRVFVVNAKSQSLLRYLVRSWFEPDSATEFGFKRFVK